MSSQFTDGWEDLPFSKSFKKTRKDREALYSQKKPLEGMSLLEMIHKAINYPMDWMKERQERLAYAFDSNRFLSFLEGVSGKVSERINAPFWIYTLWEDNRQLYVKNQSAFIDKIDVDWSAGLLIYTEEFQIPGSDEKRYREKKLSIGKFLIKVGATKEMVKEFDQRKAPTYNWKISTDWKDILTMSFPEDEGGNRGWRSCMRPKGAAEDGPLTDMLAGSAVLFFYRADGKHSDPIGRTILRPMVSLVQGEVQAVIVATDVYYGTGTWIPREDLQKAILEQTGIDIPVIRDWLEGDGKTTFSLSYGIWDDNAATEDLDTTKEEEELSEAILQEFFPQRPSNSGPFTWATLIDAQTIGRINRKAYKPNPPSTKKKGKRTPKKGSLLPTSILELNLAMDRKRRYRRLLSVAMNTYQQAYHRPRQLDWLKIESTERSISNLKTLQWTEAQIRDMAKELELNANAILMGLRLSNNNSKPFPLDMIVDAGELYGFETKEVRALEKFRITFKYCGTNRAKLGRELFSKLEAEIGL